MGVIASDRLLVKYYMDQIKKNNQFVLFHPQDFVVTNVSSSQRMMEVDKKINLISENISDKIENGCKFGNIIAEQLESIDSKMGNLFKGDHNG